MTRAMNQIHRALDAQYGVSAGAMTGPAARGMGGVKKLVARSKTEDPKGLFGGRKVGQKHIGGKFARGGASIGGAYEDQSKPPCGPLHYLFPPRKKGNVLEYATAEQQDKMQKVMGEFKRGELTSRGRTITSRPQAVAIGMKMAGLSRAQ